MGIQGLLPFLKKLHTPVNISQFHGQTVAIDAYCWLHKGAFSCAEKLALGEHTDQYVYFCMKYVEYMLKNGLKPILVFDGCHLPSKKGVEKSRRERRDIFKKKAAVFLREGKRTEARECLQRCIDVTPQMALNLMNACRERGVDCIVAPYEADAQLAYLNRVGIAQIIVTEDSDLLLFGCEKVIFKMDFNGNGFLVEKSRLNEALEIQNDFYTFEKFRYTCILSGCDYLPSLHGVGLGKAVKVFRSARQADIRQLLKKLSAYIKLKNDVPSDYVDGFIKADNTFLYQLAFDPAKRKLVPLNPYPPEIDSSELSYAGPFISDDHAYQIALGNIDINSGQRIADFNPVSFEPSKCSKKQPEHLHMLSIWNKSYRPMPKIGLKEIQPTERPVVKGKEMTVKTRIAKRPRHTTDSKDVKSDNELTDLYDELAPEAKKKKLQDPGEDCCKAEDTKSDEDSLIQCDGSEVETSPISSPLKEYHGSLQTEKPLNAADIGENVMKMEDKENNGVVPKRNKFAVSSLVKKRFNLNEPKLNVKVRSRFFAKSGDLHLKCENTNKETCLNPEQQSPLNTPDSDMDKISSDTTVYKQSIKCSIFPDKSEEPESCLLQGSSFGGFGKAKKSPGSAFHWDKFKYAETKSCDNSSCSRKQPAVSKHFKPVVASQRKSTDFFPSVVKSDLIVESQFSSEPSTSSQVQTNVTDSVSNSGSVSESLSSIIETKNTECLLSLKNSPPCSTVKKNPKNLSKFFSSSSKSSSLLNSEFSNNSISAEVKSDFPKSVPNSHQSKDVFSRLQKSVSCSLLNSSGESASEYETFSQRSNLESIDSDCLFREDVIDLTDMDNSTDCARFSLDDKKFSPRASLSQSNCKKKMCRVSGLSRSTNKKKEKIVATESQKSIKDMFSNFALKRQTERIPASNSS